MPLSDSQLSQLIVANMGQLGSDSSETNKAYDDGIKKLADAVAKAVVTHITSSGMVVIQAGTISVAGSNGGGLVTCVNPAPVNGVIQ